MEINSKGIKKSELKDYLTFWTTKLREKFGNAFVIKKESVVSNLATSSSLVNMAQEDVMMYLAKQMNPYTCEGEFQDAQYALIGLERRYSSFTTAQRTIAGVVGTVCKEGSILFKNNSTDDQFRLNTKVVIGENGTAKASFTAVELGSITLEPEELLTIIDAPDGVKGVYFAEGDNTVVGDDYEDDSEFRARWQQAQSLADSATSGGIKKYLLPLVSSDKNLKIIDNKTDDVVSGTPPHTLQVIIYTPESDETVAQTIFNHLLDGLDLYGTTTVEIMDSEGTIENISFSRAETIPIHFKVDVVLKENFALSQVIAGIKNGIIDNFDLNMGEKVIANDFIEYINDKDGVDYISDILVNQDGGDTWYKVNELDINQIAQVLAENIEIVEVE